ncbi:MAG: phytase [Gemmatimonadetes bacterium]|nr:phytase [Gemmatimonadota bacterium]
MIRLRLFLLAGLGACAGNEPEPAVGGGAPVPVTDTLAPAVITDTVVVDSDDPAIWVHPTSPESSFVLGTDKGDTNGGVYVFGLDGRIDRRRSVTPLQRMNNVDVQYDVDIGGDTVDVAVATERLRMALRVFRLPQMTAVDGGGLTVFSGDTSRAPMGVSVYRRPRDGAVFAIVGGKSGPTTGYLAQYRLIPRAGAVTLELVREFGAYSGRKEIEAIAVDDALGYVYYSDEGVGVRKYHADPDSGNIELALFATAGVVEDHEGIAIAPRDSTTGYIILSDQGGGRIHVFPREGAPGAAHQHPTLAIIPVRARETDGLEVTTRSLGPAFPRGMLAMMSNRGAFHFYRWEDVEAAIAKARPR